MNICTRENNRKWFIKLLQVQKNHSKIFGNGEEEKIRSCVKFEFKRIQGHLMRKKWECGGVSRSSITKHKRDTFYFWIKLNYERGRKDKENRLFIQRRRFSFGSRSLLINKQQFEIQILFHFFFASSYMIQFSNNWFA